MGYDDNVIFIQSDNQYENISSNVISCKNKLVYLRFMYIIFDVKPLKENKIWHTWGLLEKMILQFFRPFRQFLLIIAISICISALNIDK